LQAARGADGGAAALAQRLDADLERAGQHRGEQLGGQAAQRPRPGQRPHQRGQREAAVGAAALLPAVLDLEHEAVVGDAARGGGGGEVHGAWMPAGR
jgi:hypothetical protein